MQKEASQAMSKETLLTVGIDLGTSTTQLVLSELTVEILPLRLQYHVSAFLIKKSFTEVTLSLHPYLTNQKLMQNLSKRL